MLQNFIDGNRHSVRSEYRKASHSYLACLRDENNDLFVDGQPNCFYNLGLMQQKLGEYENSVSTFKKAQKAYTSDVTFYEGAGTSALLADRPREAQEYFEQGLKVDKYSEACTQGLGVSLLKTNNVKNAQNALEKCLKLNPRNDVCLSSIAQVEMKTKHNELAISHLQQCIDVNPQSDVCYAQLGEIYLNKFLFAPSIRYTQKAVNLAENDRYLYQLARAQRKNNQLAPALNSLVRCIQLNPKHFDAMQLAAQTSVESGDATNAVVYLEKCVQVEGNHQDQSFRQLGDVYLQLKQYAKANQSFRNSIMVNPVQTESYTKILTTWKNISGEYLSQQIQNGKEQVELAKLQIISWENQLKNLVREYI